MQVVTSTFAHKKALSSFQVIPSAPSATSAPDGVENNLDNVQD